MIAPVTLVGFDPVAREDLACVEGNERDLLLVDDGENATPGVGDAGVEVMEPAAPPQGHGALAVGDVVTETEVTPAARVRRARLG